VAQRKAGGAVVATRWITAVVCSSSALPSRTIRSLRHPPMTKEVVSPRRIFSRDINYLRDAALVWPFVISSMAAAAAAFPPSDRRFGLRCLALAIMSILLAKERLIMFLAASGFVAIQGFLTLITHKWSWPTFTATVLTGAPFLLANRYWRNPNVSYQLPNEFGAVDMLLAFASMCGTIFLLFLINRI